MTTTRQLFICETTTTATGSGVREVWEPSLEEMEALGWKPIIPGVGDVQPGPSVPFEFESRPPNGHDVETPTTGVVLKPYPGNGAPDMRAAFLGATNGHAVVQPCPVHTAPSTLCLDCDAWAHREAAP